MNLLLRKSWFFPHSQPWCSRYPKRHSLSKTLLLWNPEKTTIWSKIWIHIFLVKNTSVFGKSCRKKMINSMVLNPLPTTVLGFNQDALDKEVLNGFEIEETKIIKRTDNTKKNKKMGFNKTLFNFVVVTFSKQNMTTKIQPSKCLCHRHSCHTSFGNPLHSSRASFQKSPRHNRHLAIPSSRDPFVLCDL